MNGRSKGYIPASKIEPGDKTDEAIRRKEVGNIGISCLIQGSCY